jgi:ribosomal protein S18 acetylase RimI-like enzyme
MTTLDRSVRPPVVLAPATREATEFSARLHERALPDGFFVALGHRFLRAYHESFLASPHGIALLAWSDGRPVGFLVGTTANRLHYRWVARHRGLRLGLALLAGLLVRPHLLRPFLRTRAGRYVRALGRYLRRRAGVQGGAGSGASSPTPRRRERRPARTAVLTHVAVTDEARGRGAGSALVRAFAEEATRDGAPEAQLVTDADSDANHAFYRRRGWTHREDRRDHDGRGVSCFALDLR